MPDQAVERGRGEGAGMEAGGRAQIEVDGQVDDGCEETKRYKQAEERVYKEKK